jgi:hypothetical protein
MSKARLVKPRSNPAKTPSAGKRFPPGAILLTVIFVAALVFLWKKSQPANPTAAETAITNTPATNIPATNGAVAAVPAAAAADFQKLKGQWRRPDGGYIVDIRSVEDNGTMDAGYFNPNSIHVAKAEASREGAALKVFVELRDVNYPGSTYTLTYDPANDQLQGIYFQALQQQRFEVAFERVK